MRVLFAGTSSDVGKTTVVLGIMRALKNRGLKVQAYKAGPDYIDTAFHTFATGMPSRNLDTWMMEESVINYLLNKHAENADIAIMEGVMGMYDGADVKSLVGSSAHLAKITKTPVILIINGSGVAASAAAMVLGFKMFDKNVDIKGVVVNKVSGEYHYKLIKEAIEHHVGIPCIGYLKKNENISLKSRHLGLIPSVEVDALDEKINEVAKMVEETMDMELLLELSTVERCENIDEVKLSCIADIRLGIAKDSGFNFYYQDNLEMLEALGCQLIEFSPINDVCLPNNLHGLYIGGGFPEMFAKELENNHLMRASIKSSIEAGLPTYAECGGLMYLTDYIETLQGDRFKMVGIFENGSKMTEKLQRFGYVVSTLNSETVIGKKGETFKGHEFHRSIVHNVENVDMSQSKSYDIVKANKNSKQTWQCGYKKHQCLGGYPHIHFYSNPEIAKSFVRNCEKYKQGVQNEK